jgi:CheY-like chemotaxis protein
MRKILLVDDSQDVLMMLALALHAAGSETVSASNGNEAYDLLQKDHFDLVITDLEMPEKDGWWLLEKIQHIPRPPRVIVMSGALTVDDDALNKFGVEAFLRKPCSLDDIIRLSNIDS